MKLREQYKILVILISILVPMFSFAQGPVDPPDVIPLDGGISILLAAGVGYGVKKYKEFKANDQEANVR